MPRRHRHSQPTIQERTRRIREKKPLREKNLKQQGLANGVPSDKIRNVIETHLPQREFGEQHLRVLMISLIYLLFTIQMDIGYYTSEARLHPVKFFLYAFIKTVLGVKTFPELFEEHFDIEVSSCSFPEYTPQLARQTFELLYQPNYPGHRLNYSLILLSMNLMMRSIISCQLFTNQGIFCVSIILMLIVYILYCNIFNKFMTEKAKHKAIRIIQRTFRGALARDRYRNKKATLEIANELITDIEKKGEQIYRHFTCKTQLDTARKVIIEDNIRTIHFFCKQVISEIQSVAVQAGNGSGEDLFKLRYCAYFTPPESLINPRLVNKREVRDQFYELLRIFGTQFKIPYALQDVFRDIERFLEFPEKLTIHSIHFKNEELELSNEILRTLLASLYNQKSDKLEGKNPYEKVAAVEMQRIFRGRIARQSYKKKQEIAKQKQFYSDELMTQMKQKHDAISAAISRTDITYQELQLKRIENNYENLLEVNSENEPLKAWLEHRIITLRHLSHRLTGGAALYRRPKIIFEDVSDVIIPHGVIEAVITEQRLLSRLTAFLLGYNESLASYVCQHFPCLLPLYKQKEYSRLLTAVSKVSLPPEYQVHFYGTAVMFPDQAEDLDVRVTVPDRTPDALCFKEATAIQSAIGGANLQSPKENQGFIYQLKPYEGALKIDITFVRENQYRDYPGRSINVIDTICTIDGYQVFDPRLAENFFDTPEILFSSGFENILLHKNVTWLCKVLSKAESAGFNCDFFRSQVQIIACP
jgi:hypothetical protein